MANRPPSPGSEEGPAEQPSADGPLLRRPATADDNTRTTNAAELAALQFETIADDVYERAEELARGGLGRIVLARDRRLARTVAIKELTVDHPFAQARFAREVRITARLQHPSIVPVHEAGRWRDGTPFYAMKHVRGRPLTAAIEAANGCSERLALVAHVIDVADAMAYAHAEGILHRDLKPANVLVGPFGETVVIDWGLAKNLRDPDDRPPPLSRPVAPYETSDGTVVGTPAYMPPEQALGKPVDLRADVYALGAILYQVLAGRRPYAEAVAANVVASVTAGPPTTARAARTRGTA